VTITKPQVDRRRGPRPRRVPERTCVACRTARPKRELIRLVRTPAGPVELDASGKKSGRGAYLCRYGQCWETGLERRALERALKTQITPENREALASFAAQLPKTPPPEGRET
jgi:predicted RNA-binding protein YlxR (DUF448 family)